MNDPIKKINSGFILGLNYWASDTATRMWEDFHPQVIQEDFRRIREAGITHLRVFPLWNVFQPLRLMYTRHNAPMDYSFDDTPLPDTPAGAAGVSELACERFELFCQLANDCGLKLIVGLITGYMSSRTYAPPAFDGRDLLTDPTVIKWQTRFVRYFVSRFKHSDAIVAWDLGNETNFLPCASDNPDAFHLWATVISSTIRLADPTRPVVSGFANSDRIDAPTVSPGQFNQRSVGELCDVHTVHPYPATSAPDPISTMRTVLSVTARCRLAEDISGVPTFIQEFGSIGYQLCSRKTEADFYRCSLLAALAHDCHGTMWWCAFDQGHFDFYPYNWNNNGSDYGFFDRNGDAKPIVAENLAFRSLLDALGTEGLPPHKTDSVILVPRDMGGLDINPLLTTFMLAKQANLEPKFHYVMDPIPDAPLYILPSIMGGRSIYNRAISKHRLNELLERVRNGAVLYLSLDTGIFRQIPEFTGVDFAWRETVNAVKTLCLNGERLPIKASKLLTPEGGTAEILGTDEDGVGVFFRYPLGKGFVFLLTLPLESYAADTPGFFCKAGRPRYDSVYRTVAQSAAIRSLVDSDHPFVRLTVHPRKDGSSYIFAINYNNRPESARLTVADGYSLELLRGGSYEGGVLSLRENDGALLLLRRE